MRGFTDSGLLLFPKIEAYRNNADSYYINLRTSVNKLIAYFSEHGIELYTFTTDDVAVLTDMNGNKWLNPLIKEDVFFVKNNCKNMGIGFDNCIEYPDVLEDVKKSVPVKRGQSVEDRFEDVVKRLRIALGLIIPRFKLVIHICNGTQAAYKVHSKDGDGKCLLNVHNGKFTISAFMNGNTEDPTSLLDKPDANRPVFLWE
jgi:hypothetical protein